MCNVHIHGATSKKIITTLTVEYMRACSLTRQCCIDMKCYYLHCFSTTLLSQVSVLKATGQPKHYISQDMQLFCAPDKVVLD